MGPICQSHLAAERVYRLATTQGLALICRQYLRSLEGVPDFTGLFTFGPKAGIVSVALSLNTVLLGSALVCVTDFLVLKLPGLSSSY